MKRISSLVKYRRVQPVLPNLLRSLLLLFSRTFVMKSAMRSSIPIPEDQEITPKQASGVLHTVVDIYSALEQSLPFLQGVC